MNAIRECLLVMVILALISPANALETVTFAGRWTGQWSNSLGESGADSLVLSENEDGKLSGAWTGTVEVSGNRVNTNTAELRGRTNLRSYQITATVKADEVALNYTVTRLDSPGSYHGKALLTRIAK